MQKTYTSNFYYNSQAIIIRRSMAEIKNVYIKDNTTSHHGIKLDQSNAELYFIEIDHVGRGIYWHTSVGNLEDVKIYNNDKGLYVVTSKVMFQNHTGYYMNNNTSDITCVAGGQIFVNTDDDITDTTPAANTSPTTSGFNSFNYIGKTVF
jgi:hypothetical protein